MVAGIKSLPEVQIGDTLTSADHPADEPLPGFQEVKPMVFAGLYPTDTTGYEGLRDAMEKLASALGVPAVCVRKPRGRVTPLPETNAVF